MTRHHCADVSRHLGESLAATAPPAAGSWLAVEHHGPWPSHAARAALPPAARDVVSRAAAMGVRTQLLRRPGRRRTTPPPHTVLLAGTRAHRPWLEEAVLDDLAGLSRLDLAALAAGAAPGFGTARHRPVLLVCTHGRRDACCAEYGRPVALAMATAHPGQVWETTHLAGDRFAANVACLPHGTYHGRITPGDAHEVAAACVRGEVLLDRYRGRAGLPAPAQAAEQAVRAHTGLTGVTEVRVEHVEARTEATYRVRVAAGGRTFRVTVAAVAAGPPRATSCDGCPFGVPVTYQIRGLDERVLAPAPAVPSAGPTAGPPSPGGARPIRLP